MGNYYHFPAAGYLILIASVVTGLALIRTGESAAPNNNLKWSGHGDTLNGETGISHCDATVVVVDGYNVSMLVVSGGANNKTDVSPRPNRRIAELTKSTESDDGHGGAFLDEQYPYIRLYMLEYTIIPFLVKSSKKGTYEDALDVKKSTPGGKPRDGPLEVVRAVWRLFILCLALFLRTNFQDWPVMILAEFACAYFALSIDWLAGPHLLRNICIFSCQIVTLNVVIKRGGLSNMKYRQLFFKPNCFVAEACS